MGGKKPTSQTKFLKWKDSSENGHKIVQIMKTLSQKAWKHYPLYHCQYHMGMEIRILKILFFLSFLVLPSNALASSDSSLHRNFIHCLLNQSHPSYPITKSIYTLKSSSYSSLLRSYLRNLRFNSTETRKPFLILAPLHESHIQSAIVCARKHRLLMKIRSGGHDFEGLSYVSQEFPFFILDMFKFNSIDINLKHESAWVEAGATLGELYHTISEKSKIHGFPAGVCRTVGVGGHFSGGGYGNMMRKYGLSIDHMIDARIVDVNGRVLGRKSMGEDLFWAIRGGGGASFGVIIAYKIKLVRVPETVTVFRVEKTLEQNATDIVHQWQLVSHKLHKDLFIRVVLQVVNKTQEGNERNSKTVKATFVSFFLGNPNRLLSIMNNSLPALGLGKSDCIETSWIGSVLFWDNLPIETPLTILLDRASYRASHMKRKSDYVKEPISREGLEWIWKKMMELEFPVIQFNPYGGKMSKIPETETPFPHRAGNLWKIEYAINWEEEGDEAANYQLGLIKQMHSYMIRFVSKNPREAFLNYRDLDLGINKQNGRNSYEEGRVYGVKYFKGNFDRLVQVKTKVDPANFFRSEQSIPSL